MPPKKTKAPNRLGSNLTWRHTAPAAAGDGNAVDTCDDIGEQAAAASNDNDGDSIDIGGLEDGNGSGAEDSFSDQSSSDEDNDDEEGRLHQTTLTMHWSQHHIDNEGKPASTCAAMIGCMYSILVNHFF